MKRMHRRDFLKGLTACAGGVAASGIIPGLGTHFAQASCQGNNTCLIIVEMAGGFDALDICTPQLNELSNVRPTLYKTNGHPFANNTRLHPLLTNFHTLIDAGNLLAVQCVGPENPSGSHDEATSSYEIGTDERGTGPNTGWGNRLAQNLGCNSPFDAFDLTSGSNRILNDGAFLPVSVSNPADFDIDDLNRINGNQNNFMQEKIYRSMARAALNGTLGVDLQDARTTVENSVSTIQNVVDSFNPSGGAFPQTGIGRDCQDAFMVLRDLGTKCVTLRQGGYDTHGDQDDRHADLLSELNDAIGALIDNLQAAGLWNRTIIYFVSEFARTTSENSNMGTDHARATTQLLCGGGVQGGVINTINPSDITSGDRLEVKTNVTSVLKGICSSMGVSNPDDIIPGPHAALRIT